MIWTTNQKKEKYPFERDPEPLKVIVDHEGWKAKEIVFSSYNDYLLVSLISHVWKAFLRIICEILQKCENQKDKTQFEFRVGDTLFSLNVLP